MEAQLFLSSPQNRPNPRKPVHERNEKPPVFLSSPRGQRGIRGRWGSQRTGAAGTAGRDWGSRNDRGWGSRNDRGWGSRSGRGSRGGRDGRDAPDKNCFRGSRRGSKKSLMKTPSPPLPLLAEVRYIRTEQRLHKNSVRTEQRFLRGGLADRDVCWRFIEEGEEML